MAFDAQFAFHGWDIYAFLGTHGSILDGGKSSSDDRFSDTLRENIINFAKTGLPKNKDWIGYPQCIALISDQLNTNKTYNEELCQLWRSDEFFSYSWVNWNRAPPPKCFRTPIFYLPLSACDFKISNVFLSCSIVQLYFHKWLEKWLATHRIKWQLWFVFIEKKLSLVCILQNAILSILFTHLFARFPCKNTRKLKLYRDMDRPYVYDISWNGLWNNGGKIFFLIYVCTCIVGPHTRLFYKPELISFQKKKSHALTRYAKISWFWSGMVF